MVVWSHAFCLVKKIQRTHDSLHEWNHTVFGELQSKIRSLEAVLDWLQSFDGEIDCPKREAFVRNELLHVQKMEKDLWRLKSRTTWLMTRDLNTRYFHLSTIIHRCRNSIDTLKTAAGSWIIGRQRIGDYIVQHFQTAFTSGCPEIPFSLEDLIQPVLSSNEKELLVVVPNETEIHGALFQIGPHKAPGPDGMTGLFFQHFGQR